MRTRLPLTAALAALLLTACSSGADETATAGGGSDEVLQVVTEGTYAPFSFHAEGTTELTGYDVEVEPYTVSTRVVVTPSGDTSVDALEDVAGKRSAQSTTSSFGEIAREAGAQVEAVEGFAQAVTLLKQERVDVTINDSLAVLEYQKTTGDDDISIAAEIDQQSEQAFVFRADSEQLQADVDRALETLRADGTLAAISEEYFGEDVSGA